MASSSREKPRKTQGIRIDSSLISTTSSSDIQNGLEGLGVSVFDQGTFEEGVMQQLDKEVARRTHEQQRKFLLQEYSRVKQERSTLQRELETLSKKIATLLSRPLCDVVLTLREMKAVQEQKRKQAIQLEVREQELLKKIRRNVTASDTVPTTSWSSEQETLIQSGHMTPFGTSDPHTTPTKAKDDEVKVSDKSNNETPGLRLCSEGFDGLFESQSSVVPLKKKGVSPLGAQRKGKERKRSIGHHSVRESDDVRSEIGGGGERSDGALGEDVRGVDGEEEVGEGWMPTREEVEEMEREMMEEKNDWQEEEEEDGSTEYSTDEELGADHVLGRVPAKKKQKRRRPLSSEESEEGEGGEGERWRRRKRRRKVSRVSPHLDDGDEEIFQLRMREGVPYDTPSASDKLIDGRLRVPRSIWSRLYGYQRTGVHWLWELHCQQAGGVVGDEMGLGKTIQMIAFLAALRVSRLRSHVTRELGLGPVLVVCPATVMHQWVSEFHTWQPQFRVAVLHDTGTYRGPKSALIANIVQCNGVLVTTYAGVRIYRDHLLPRKWDYVILDEGHKIRNPDTEVTLVCKQFPTPHRIILSGCPMQNNLRELWSLFDFVFPGKLGTLPVFMEQFSVPITLGGYANATQVQVQTAYRCACILRDTINPYLLRRLKADVKIQLPSKNEQVLFCELTEYQRELYEEYVTGPDVAAMLVGRKKIFTGLMVLRKLCNHPDLVTNDYRECVTYGKGEEEEGEDEEDRALIRSRTRRPLRRKRSTSMRDSEMERGETEEGVGLAGYCEEKFGWGQRSGKMIVVEALLKMWCEQKHHVLLFSQSKMMLSILELMVQAKGYSYVRMDGDTPIKARQPLIRRFNETPSIFVFLLTTRVGGLGVNLTGANRIIIYDPDWNPSTDTQAQERAWRIGQKRQVTIYRLLTSGTIEEKIYHRQIFKQFLTNRVLKDPRQRRFFKANDLYELFSLGQIQPKGGTETSAIFAGTGADVSPKKLKKCRRRSHDKDRGLRKPRSESCDHPEGELHDDEHGLEVGDGTGMKQCSRDGLEQNGDGQRLSRDSTAVTKDREGEEGGERGGEGDADVVTETGRRESDKGRGEERRFTNNDPSSLSIQGENRNNIANLDPSTATYASLLPEAPSSSAAASLPDESEGQATSEGATVEPTTSSGPRDKLCLEIDNVVAPSSEVREDIASGDKYGKEGFSEARGDLLAPSSTGHDNGEIVSGIENGEKGKETCLALFGGTLVHSSSVREVASEQKKRRKEKEKKKKKKEHKRHRHHKKKHTAVVEGIEISGVNHTGLYRGTEGEEEAETQRTNHDDFILNKLFKKSGVHSAIQHDSIMSGGSSDYVVVETEAKKVAQSAARALRESRRRCLAGGGGWGQLTWTGQYGSAGGRSQQPRFGARAHQTQTKVTVPGSSQMFNGQKSGTSLLSSSHPSHPSPSSSSSSSSSLHPHTTSSGLLSAIRSRNAHTLPQYAVKDIHKSTHEELMREIRDFIATRCKFDGQASTEELLGHFSAKLPNSDTATFRSMLREICDFSRIHGEGRWFLKSQFR